jgi:hypothetical protein
MILRPLQKIQVVQSTKKCKPNSLGYFVAQDPVGDYNAWQMCIVFTRFGKKGKPRIETLPLDLPMVDYNTMKPADRDILNIVYSYEGLEPRTYTDRKGNNTSNLRDTVIEPIKPTGPKDLLRLPDDEFTAYIVAMSLFIYKLIYRQPARSLNMCPIHINLTDFADNRFSLATVAPEYFGYHILKGIQMDDLLRKKQVRVKDGSSFEYAYNHQIDSARKKRHLLDRLQRSIAMAKNELDKYNRNVQYRYDRTNRTINDVLKFYKHNKKELANVKNRDKSKPESKRSYHNYSHTSKYEAETKPMRRRGSPTASKQKAPRLMVSELAELEVEI